EDPVLICRCRPTRRPTECGDRTLSVRRGRVRIKSSDMSAILRTSMALGLVLGLGHATPAAGVKFGAPFGDHMVVQRDRPVRIWGEADPGIGVEVRFGPRRAAVT